MACDGRCKHQSRVCRCNLNASNGTNWLRRDGHNDSATQHLDCIDVIGSNSSSDADCVTVKNQFDRKENG